MRVANLHNDLKRPKYMYTKIQIRTALFFDIQRTVYRDIRGVVNKFPD